MSKPCSIIAELRREAGYTQKSLARALNVTDKAVSKWERGICMPDSALLPKLALLLDADIEFFLSHGVVAKSEWVGLIDLSDYDVDLKTFIYDKPLVYYVLSHFLLLDITTIYVCTTERNKKYLKSKLFRTLGMNIVLDFGELPKRNMMVINSPCFLFGSDLTRQFQGGMVAKTLIKMVPYKQRASFLFCPSEETKSYFEKSSELYENALERTLGRGMINVNMIDKDAILNVAEFIRFYQNSTGVLIGSLEEIAYRKGYINGKQLLEIVNGKYNFDLFVRMIEEGK